MNRRVYFLLVCCLVTGFTQSPALYADIFEYTSGHGDIGLEFHDGELEIHYHFGGDTHYEPDEAYVRVSDDAINSFNFALPFLGLDANEQFWQLPQTGADSLGIPDLGLSRADLVGASNVRFALNGFSGPGEFSLWEWGATPIARWSTVDPSVSNEFQLVGSHSHFNWGFTEAGVYDLTIEGLATIGGVEYSSEGTFKFVVGSATAVPEPGSMAVLSLVAACGYAVKRRRAKRTLQQQ